MKIGNIELTEEKLIIAIAAGAAIAGLALYAIFYAPLLVKIKNGYLECRAIENDVIDMRNTIETAGKVYGDRILQTEDEVHHALDELTKHGSKLEGINFLSIRPKEIEGEKGAEYKIMPVEVVVESSYEQLGVFLGSLDDLEKGLLKVKSFDIDQDEKNPGKFITDVTIDIYISGRK